MSASCDSVRLWEADHSYYCNLGNYFDNNCETEYKSWAEFIDSCAGEDLDLNLVFRWDWREGSDNDLPDFNGDNYYRNGRLEIFYIGQRKGLFRTVQVSVCRADEPDVRKWLFPRWEHLKSLWTPVCLEAGGE